MNQAKKLISICIPVYNEEANIRPLLAELEALADSESAYDFEFIFTDNCSTDNTYSVIAEKAMDDSRIRALRFTRNFGFQKSILTNYLEARGDAAVQIDADLQDPPALISEFLRAWEDGYKVVYGIRRKRKEASLLTAARKVYYRTISWLSETDVPPDAGDFRLIDREILDHLGSVSEQTPYLRGTISNLGYSQTGIPYDRESRKSGLSKFSLFALIEFGIDGITSQTVRPLRMITLFGFTICLATFIVSLVYLTLALLSPTNESPGFTTIVILVLASIGINAFFLGLLGEYIGRIFNNTRGLPVTIIEERVGYSGGRDREPGNTRQEQI